MEDIQAPPVRDAVRFSLSLIELLIYPCGTSSKSSEVVAWF